MVSNISFGRRIFSFSTLNSKEKNDFRNNTLLETQKNPIAKNKRVVFPFVKKTSQAFKKQVAKDSEIRLAVNKNQNSKKSNITPISIEAQTAFCMGEELLESSSSCDDFFSVAERILKSNFPQIPTITVNDISKLRKSNCTLDTSNIYAYVLNKRYCDDYSIAASEIYLQTPKTYSQKINIAASFVHEATHIAQKFYNPQYSETIGKLIDNGVYKEVIESANKTLFDTIENLIANYTKTTGGLSDVVCGRSKHKMLERSNFTGDKNQIFNDFDNKIAQIANSTKLPIQKVRNYFLEMIRMNAKFEISAYDVESKFLQKNGCKDTKREIECRLFSEMYVYVIELVQEYEQQYTKSLNFTV